MAAICNRPEVQPLLPQSCRELKWAPRERAHHLGGEGLVQYEVLAATFVHLALLTTFETKCGYPIFCPPCFGTLSGPHLLGDPSHKGTECFAAAV